MKIDIILGAGRTATEIEELGLLADEYGLNVQPGRPELLKRTVSSTTHGQVRPLEQTGARVMRGALDGRHVGRCRNPWQAGLRGPLRTPPATCGDHSQPRSNRELLIEHQSELTRRHSMAHGDRKEPHKGGERRIQYIALHQLTADRIRSIRDHEQQTGHRGRFHRPGHGRHIRVVTRSDILDIEHQGVEILQNSRIGCKALTIQRVDRKPGGQVVSIRDRFARPRAAPQSMFRRQQRDDFDPGLEQQGRGRPAVPGHSSMIGNQPYTKPRQHRRGVGSKHFDSGLHGVGRRRPRAARQDHRRQAA